MTWPVGFLFTPQQLQGSVKYSSGVRLGNWREDDALDDLRLMDYVEAKERGSLTLTAKREMRTPQIAQRTLSTASSDGIVRNGDLLQLTHLSGALPQRCSTEADATKPRHSPKRRSLLPRARPSPPQKKTNSLLLSGAVVAANMGQQLKELDDMGVLHPVPARPDLNPDPHLHSNPDPDPNPIKVTGSSNAVPIARNSLRIMSFAGAEGEPVVYGQELAPVLNSEPEPEPEHAPDPLPDTDPGQDVCFICDAGGVGVLASARPATSHLGSQLVAKQDVFLTMVARGHV